MKAANTLVPSTKIHGVTSQKTVILTMPEDLWSHVLTLFFPNDNRNLRCHWDQHLCYHRYFQRTLELTLWIICVGNRLTAKVALQVKILYFFYFVSMIHKMAASYTRDVFKVNEFPFIISAGPIISLYKTMCWATNHVTKLASLLQQRVPFNKSQNLIYWENLSQRWILVAIQLHKRQLGSASNLDVSA